MIIEGHDVEKATEMVVAMQSSRVGAASKPEQGINFTVNIDLLVLQ